MANREIGFVIPRLRGRAGFEIVVVKWPQRLADMQTFLAGVVVLPYSETVAVTWGESQAAAQLRGRPRPANDAWIAACCLTRGLPLATLNLKDFADFVEHDGLILIPS